MWFYYFSCVSPKKIFGYKKRLTSYNTSIIFNFIDTDLDILVNKLKFKNLNYYFIVFNFILNNN